MNPSTLVVGGAGYVGSHVVKHRLSKGATVKVFDNLSRGHRNAALSAEFFDGDLLDQSRLRDVFKTRNFDVVMHFAAFCNVGESVQKPATYYRNNVTGMLNLLDAMLEASVSRLVFSSTCSTYGDPMKIPMRESQPQHPINPYGASKLMVETILKDYSHAYDLNSVSLRSFNAAGGDPATTSLVVHGNDYDTPDGTCVRDYVHVDDLAAAHLIAAERMVAGTSKGATAFNLGTENGFSVLEVIESCRKITGIPIQYKIGPRRPGNPPRLIANSEKARNELGWVQRYREVDQIVETAWRWFSA